MYELIHKKINSHWRLNFPLYHLEWSSYYKEGFTNFKLLSMKKHCFPHFVRRFLPNQILWNGNSDTLAMTINAFLVMILKLTLNFRLKMLLFQTIRLLKVVALKKPEKQHMNGNICGISENFHNSSQNLNLFSFSTCTCTRCRQKNLITWDRKFYGLFSRRLDFTLHRCAYCDLNFQRLLHLLSN